MLYDVAIIGAGPAGSVFARELAQRKPELKILLIDGQSEGMRKVCGGLLAPDAQKLLAKFDLALPKSVLADPQIFAVETLDLDSRLKRCYQRHYLNMDRYAFDLWLLSLVPNTVDIMQGRCTSLCEHDGGYKIKLNLDGSETEINTATLVGADGASSIVRRTLFDKKLYQYASIQEWFEYDGDDIPYYSCIFDPKTSPSCSWTIRKDNYVVFGGAFERANCRQAFEEQKARLESFLGHSFGNAVKTEACLLSSPKKMSDFVVGKKGVYLAGEAAGFISASSFEGISSAILSGKLLADSFAEGKEHANILKLYKKKTKKLRLKLYLKIQKRRVLCSPLLRYLIMKSGIQSVEKYT